MLDFQIKKPVDTEEKCKSYETAVIWCRKNDAQPVDMGDYYVVVANEHPELTTEEKATSIRSERDAKIDETQWLVERHSEELTRVQLKRETATTLTDAQYNELLDYRQALRDVPEQKEFPDKVTWPKKPSFLK